MATISIPSNFSTSCDSKLNKLVLIYNVHRQITLLISRILTIEFSNSYSNFKTNKSKANQNNDKINFFGYYVEHFNQLERKKISD